MGGRMEKTDRQMVLELQRGKPIREIIEETLEKYRGRKHHQMMTALELDISVTTLHYWTKAMEIDLKAYGERIPAGVEEG